MRDRALRWHRPGRFGWRADHRLARASDPFPTPLGTLDAIHLATALLAREQGGPRLFATHDAELAVAARAMGFGVLGA